MKKMISQMFNHATKAQQDAAAALLDARLLEFELCVIRNDKEGCSISSVSGSTRDGMSAMAVELLRNLKKQWGEVELRAVLVKILRDCSEVTVVDLLDGIKNNFGEKVLVDNAFNLGGK